MLSGRKGVVCALSGLAAGLALPPIIRALRRYWQRLRSDDFAASIEVNAASIEVNNDPIDWAAASGRGQLSADFFAMYSSVTGKITTDPALMTIPIDDHAVVRGHAVFDTCSLCAGRLYRLQIHLQRLFSSAAAARLQLPFGDGDSEENRAIMTEIVAAACRASGRKDADVRFWLSAGTGNLGVTPAGCKAQFYVLVFGGLPMDPQWALDGISEVSLTEDIVPLKPPLLAELKSNNYMLNALTMMAARDRGGTFGILVDGSGHLLESCVLNVALVRADGMLATPTFERALAGTTACPA